MTTFCLIHGNWHDASCWETVAERLRERGHVVVAPDMPFDDPSADYEARARPAVEALAGASGPIAVVGHSVGAAEAELVAAKLDVSLLVYLCPRFGWRPASGAPPVFREGFPFPRRAVDGRSVWGKHAAIAAMYPRLPPDVAEGLAERLRPGALPVGDHPLDRRPDIPTALIYATDDEFFTPEWEQFVARELLGIEPIEIAGGHFPMIEDPVALAALFDELAPHA